MTTRTAPATTTAPADGRAARRASVTLPGILLGLGLGGFVDGIVLHQVLQWHHMRTGDGAGGGEPMTTVAGLEANTLADGVFHIGTWALVVLGLSLLWARLRREDGPRPWAELTGLLIVGWGVFNLVEGVANHHILGIHHVRDDEGAPLAWDLGFLALGAALALAGWLIARAARARAARTA
jgi:uncharacterized membrane protein